jgi:glycosyltransferase 2 family protein
MLEENFKMEAALNSSVKKWISISAFIGFAVFLLYLYFFTDIVGVASIIGSTNLFVYSLAFMCILASVSFITLAWDCLLKALAIKVNFRRVFDLTWVGIFVDAIIPGGWSGDAFMVYLISRDPKIDTGKAAASIVMKNVLELLIVIGLAFLGLVLLSLNYSLESGVLITIGTALALMAMPFVVIIYLSINLNATRKILRRLRLAYSYLRRRSANIEDFEQKIGEKLKEYHDGLSILKANPKPIFQTVLFEIIAWSFEIIALFIVFVSIGEFISADKVIITNILSTTLQTQGVAFAGFTQVVTASVYTILGISPNLSAASTVLSGFASFWFRTIIAFFAFQFVVLSRCVPPFCIRLSELRGKNNKDDKLPVERE